MLMDAIRGWGATIQGFVFFGVRIKVRGLRIRVWVEKTRLRVGIGAGIGHRTP